ncbi:YfjP family GTPase [Streptomyces sp. V3I7]|uniref:YfjP family GTPase n=1 Tax=Streptomyces sp. V3I7 TaxID=3042278 RepID=UPI0027867707|nr:YfjP family GTPase [Streptomyces sp. V3I7]MDQ0990970.1 energy-coupling factor transporter ATP-binding protein EcfA2 [Streptomyces sp. V3I7]
MTAVTDQDHTEHAEHTGDTGSRGPDPTRRDAEARTARAEGRLIALPMEGGPGTGPSERAFGNGFIEAPRSGADDLAEGTPHAYTDGVAGGRAADRRRDDTMSAEPAQPEPADEADDDGAQGEDEKTQPHARGTDDERHADAREPGGAAEDPAGAWDDGLIARRLADTPGAERAVALQPRGAAAQGAAPLAYDGELRSRLDALHELVGLSRPRLDSPTLAEAGRVLDEAAARRRLSGLHTVVAIAGATGSGKSQLFNALAGVAISETGVRRPTTAAPIACSWSDGAASLIDRLGIPGRLRRRPLQSPEAEAQLRGLVLIDLPDHDSAAVQHREQVDRILKLVDAVIWVVDPEKYADAVLHERYLRPMAGHAEVMFIVLNQIDRLPGEATEQVLDDLRRLLDEDGIALGEYGDLGATVLALSALTGEGLGDLREVLGQFVAERGAAARRVTADVDAAAAGLRPVYVAGQRTGLSEEDRDAFSASLADAVGATAAGEAAERAWLRNANKACGTPWLRLWHWYQDRCDPPTGRLVLRAAQEDEEATARQRVEQAVRTVSERAAAGLPTPWAQAVREAAVRGSEGLSEALDELAAGAAAPVGGSGGRPPRPGWWPLAVFVQASMTLLQIVGGLWLVGQIVGVMAPNLGVPVLLMVAGIVGGPLVEWGCRMAARGPARRYGLDAERRLREAAAGCGRARVLDPLAAELLRYREVREQYGKVSGSGAPVG